MKRPNPIGLPLLLVFVIGVAAAIYLPRIVPDFLTYQFTLAMGWGIAMLGLNVLTGFNGQFSIGHSAFFAAGAYTAAICIAHFGWGPYESIIAAAVVSFIFGFLFGLPALRLEGLYLALATFSLAVATPQLLKFDAFEEWTGGVQGIYVAKPEPLIEGLSQDQSLYYVALAIFVFLMVVTWCLLRSRSGRSMMAIRDNPIAAETMGINLPMVKTTTFGISAMYAGIGGAVFTYASEFVSPDAFNFFIAVYILVGSVVGGIVSIGGAIFGGLFIVFMPNFAQDISLAYPWVPPPWAIFGILLILVIYFVPFGIWGGIERLLAWSKAKR
ncbi:MAG: branched-chain amino acid ABC transporter permease [Pseudomonadota bacterium]